ncbi:MAG: DUF2568 domain-containing protein [Pseudomonadota bacterium]
MGALNLAVRFGLELVLLVALAWRGFTLDAPLLVRILVGLAAPAAAVAVWARWIAPRAAGRLADPLRFGVETVLWIAGAGALAAVAGAGWGIAFLVLALVSAALVRVWPEPVHERRPR